MPNVLLFAVPPASGRFAGGVLSPWPSNLSIFQCHTVQYTIVYINYLFLTIQVKLQVKLMFHEFTSLEQTASSLGFTNKIHVVFT